MVFVTGAYGLGENVVQGAVDPDEFYVFKPTSRRGIERCCDAPREQEDQDDLQPGGGRATTRNVPTPDAERERFCISDDEVLTLADYAIKLEKHYSAKAGQARPIDMESAKDGTRRPALYGSGAPGNCRFPAARNMLRRTS